MPNVGHELLNVPFPEMVEQLGMSIAKAQYALDMNSMRVAQIMSGSDWIDKNAEGKEIVREGLKVNFGGRMLSLLELGFTPTFYQFVDTIIEVKISVSMTSSTEEKHSKTDVDMDSHVKAGWGKVDASMHISTVSASFAARNSFSAEGASLIRTKLVPLPPPAVLQDRIRMLMEEQKKKEIAFDPAVVEIRIVGDTNPAAIDITSDTKVSKVTSSEESNLPATITGSGEDEKRTVHLAPNKTLAAGVHTIKVEGEGHKRGQIKVLVTKVASS